MNNQDFLLLKLEEAIKECSIHIERANYALLYIDDFFPLGIKQYEELKKQEEQMLLDFKASDKDYTRLENMKTEYFDQFIYRYSKLQDRIGKSIFKSLGDLLEYRTETLSFIDYLNIAEKHGVIDNTSDWLELRSVRNSISHEYDDNDEYQVAVLNKIYDSYQLLLTIFDRIKKKFKSINKK